MADNTVLNVGTGGDTIATDDITTLNGGVVSGIKAQRVKVCYGDDASARDVSILFPMPIIAPPITPVDKSGSITTAATAQVLAAANAVRRGWWIRNNSTTSLFVSDITTAVQTQASLELRAGEYFESVFGGCSSSALSIIGPTAGATFTAREW